MSAVFLPMSADMSSKHDRYRALAPLFESCDLVLVEGDSATNAPKIEVWRSVLGKEPLAANDESILATVSDDAPLVKCSVYPRSDVSALAEWVLNTVIKTRID